MYDGFINTFNQVKSISEIVVDVWEMLILLKCHPVELYCNFGFSSIIVRITKSNQSLEFFGIVLEGLLVVFNGLFSITSLKKKISHTNKSKRELFVLKKSFFQIISWFFKFFSVEIQDSKLGQCFKVSWLSLKNLFKILDWSSFIFTVLLDCFTETEVRIDWIRINF